MVNNKTKKVVGRSAVKVAKGDYIIANYSRQNVERLFNIQASETREAMLNDSLASETSDPTLSVNHSYKTWT